MIGRWQNTVCFFAEQLVAIACNDVVGAVTQRRGDNLKDAC